MNYSKPRFDVKLLHPVLITLYPILQLYSHNRDEASLAVLFLPICISLFCLGLLWSLSWLFFRNTYKASLFSGLLSILTFSYGHLFLFYGQSPIAQFVPIGPNAVLLGLSGSVIVIGFFSLLRLKNPQGLTTDTFAFVSLFLVLIPLITLLPHEPAHFLNTIKMKRFINTISSDTAPYVHERHQEIQPDIYYLVFDRYGRQDILQEYFDYDNTAFLTSLEDRAFYVATASAANYPTTYQSLASSLNMMHLDRLARLLGPDSNDKKVVNALLRDSLVQRLFKQLGYHTIFMGDFYEPTKISHYADENINEFKDFEPFYLELYETTILNILAEKLGGNRLYSGVAFLNKVGESRDIKFSQLHQVINRKSDVPKFVFAHFLLPHEPYLHDKHCRLLTFEQVRKRTSEKGFIDQLQCANIQMLKFIDAIQAKNKHAVIILQSDEGPFLPSSHFTPDHSFKQNYSKESVKIHSSILNAYFFPTNDGESAFETGAYSTLYSNITPINTFPLIFNNYFGYSLPLREDTTFIAPNNEQPFQFVNVTSVVQAN